MVGSEQIGPGLFVKIGADTTGLDAGLNKAKTSLKDWRDETNTSTRSMLEWGAAIGATVAPVMAVGYAAYQAAEKYGAMAQQLKDLSYQTGISTGKLQQLQYASVLSGTQFDKVSLGLNTLTQSMADAGDKSSKAYKAFLGLGIDPQGRSPEEVFDATASALVSMEDVTRRNQYAMDLYGRSWKEMLPYMESYIKNAKEIKEHPWMTENEIRELERSKIELDKIGSSLTILAGKSIAFAEAWSQNRLWMLFLPDTVTKDEAALRDLSVGFEDAGEAALKLAADATTARRKLEDLYMSIDESRLTSTEAGQSQRALGDEYNELINEQHMNERIIAHSPDSSEAIGKQTRNNEIQKRLTQITNQMNRNNLALVKAGTTRERAYEDITAATTPAPDLARAAEMIKTVGNVLQITGMIPVAGGKTVNITLNQTNTNVDNDGDALDKAIGKILAIGDAIP